MRTLCLLRHPNRRVDVIQQKTALHRTKTALQQTVKWTSWFLFVGHKLSRTRFFFAFFSTFLFKREWTATLPKWTATISKVNHRDETSWLHVFTLAFKKYFLNVSFCPFLTHSERRLMKCIFIHFFGVPNRIRQISEVNGVPYKLLFTMKGSHVIFSERTTDVYL